MKRLSILAVLTLIVVSIAPVSATIPAPPSPDPARLEAARALMQVPTFSESLFSRVEGVPSARSPLTAVLYAEVGRLRPDMDPSTLGLRVRVMINLRIDRALRQSQAAIIEDIATEFARMFNVEQLTAATNFYGSPQGRMFAWRMVSSDPLFANVLLARFQSSLSAELESLVADAEAGERLRRRVNSS